MGKIGLILSVLVFTAMTMSFASAAEESRENPPRGMIEHDDRDGDGVVSRSEFSGPADHFDKLDTNGDGTIQKSEAMQGPPGMPRRDRKNQ